ncbi:MAG: hypothetical protein OXU36_03255 [Candidatus Poribacteria bacterium]|nr:hypothetical protein [Candidatus Poribacteria bacterium]
MNRSKILENIRNQIGEENLFSGNSFRRGRCSVDLTGVSEDDRVVVDLDKVFPTGQKGENQCECILFYFNDAGNFVVVPMELKGGGNAEALKAVQQLKAGADFAAGYTPRGPKSICHPILFHNGISRAEVRQLNKNQSRVRFRGKSFEIKTTRCGRRLVDVLP